MSKRIIAMFLTLVMMFTAIPTNAIAVLAAENNVQAIQETSQNVGNSSENLSDFSDVSKDSWYYDSVKYVKDNGIFSGVGANQFDPNGELTRAMFVTVLGRMAGVDTPSYQNESEFSDVPNDAYYAPYVAWAKKHGITVGTGEGKFAPDSAVTRQEMATFFVRYFDTFKVEYDTGKKVDTTPEDISSVASWAKDAVLKLWSVGLLNGDGKSFDPYSKATRAEAAALCERTDKSVKVWYKEPNVPADAANDGAATGGAATGGAAIGGAGSNIIGAVPSYYAVTFETNGGQKLAKQKVKRGTLVSELPTPYLNDHIFTGWYYDKALSKSAAESDTITRDVTLYASYSENEPLEPVVSHTFASAMDVGADFSVSLLSSNKDLTAEQVKNAITVEVIADSSKTDLFEVSGSNGEYKVYGKNGFEEGKTFRISLHDTRLSFEGELDTVREYNFSTSKEEVLNVTISNDMKFVPMEDVSDIINNGESVETLSIALYEADTEGNIGPADLTEGSFTYNGSLTLEVGDVISVYEGLRPDLRTLESTEEENGDLAYVEITAVDGNRISYKNADAEQVIFTPDVLPVSAEADQDDVENTLTLDNICLDFSDDIYANMELDSQTTVDVGDYLLIYTGVIGENEALQCYGEILKVSMGEDTTVIEYEVVTWDEIESTMDIYAQEQINGAQILEGVDVESIEAAVEQHALDSGFAEEAGLYLASLAFATDSFTEWKDDVNLNDVKFTLDDGTPLSPEEVRLMAENKVVKVEREKLNATISTTLQHFEGYSGLRLTLDVGIKITIKPSDKNDFSLEITVTGSFEQEVRLAIGASSEAIWKVWGIFPYIAEYRVDVNVDLFDFTGIEIEANMITPEAEDDDDDDKDDDKDDGKDDDKDDNKDDDKDDNKDDDKDDDKDDNKDDGKDDNKDDGKDDDKDDDKDDGRDDGKDDGKDDVLPGMPGSQLPEKDKDDDKDDGKDDVLPGMPGSQLPENEGGRVEIKPGNRVDMDDVNEIVGQINKGVNLAKQIKEILQKKEDSSENGDGDEEEAKTISSALQEKYKEMLESDAEWVNIIEKEIFNKEFQVPPPLPIVAIKVKADFVVQVKASVSVGFKFEYINGKRYMYHINVFAGQISNDVVDIQEETYEFTFYAMGHLGIKAGVELEIHIGIISADIASIGFTAEAGVYAKLWGYFYYELKYTASDGRSQNYSGALLIEVGAYLELGLKLSALGGLASKDVKILDKEWPFWSVGKEDCVQDFVTPADEMPEVKLKQYIKSTVLSDDLFKMSYLDMKEGDMKQAVYSDEDRFIISIDNPAFQYDTETNTLSVTPREGAKKEEGTMTITWIAYPLAFTSKPIQRTVSLYWDNLRDGYVIVPYTNGGSYIQLINQKFESVVKVPEDPVKGGYVFAGWYSDADFTESYEWPTLMPDIDTNIYAKWEPATDTPYVVEYYQQILGTPDYTLVERKELNGATDSIVTPETPYYTGFITPIAEDVKILADGSTVQRYYYDRQTHTVTFDPGIVGGDPVSYELDFEGRVTIPQFAAKGYIFTGWDREVESTMGESDVTYTAQWIVDPATTYRVEYYVQQTDGRYVMQDFAVFDGSTGDALTEQQLRETILIDNGEGIAVNADTKYLIKDGVSFNNITVFGEDLTAKGENPVIAANGKTVIKVNYKRHSYNLTFDLENGEEDLSYSVYYGADISLPKNVRRKGYALTGWTPEFIDSMAAKDTTYTAQWKANDYTIAFDSNEGIGTMENQPAVYDVAAALYDNAFTRVGYDFAGWAIIRNGTVRYQDKEEVSNLASEIGTTTTLYASWTPIVYDIKYHNTLPHSNPATYTIESGAVTLMNPEDKEGYTFTGWFENEDFSGNPVIMIESGSHGNVDLYAGYVPNPYEIKFNANGGEGETATLAMTYDVEKELTENGFTRSGYTFLGWAKTANGSVVYSDKSPVINLESRTDKVVNLYAVWSLDIYNIEYEVDKGINASGNPKTYTVLDSITLSEPSRIGYSFGGWLNEDGDKIESIQKGTTGNLEFTAEWIPNDNTPYVVEHYKRDIDKNTYTLSKREIFTGTTDKDVTPVTEEYEGFRAPEEITKPINADGSLVIQYYYDRLTYSLTLLYKDEANSFETITEEYGKPITLPHPTRDGYGFAGWYLEDGTNITANTMPALTATLEAIWKPGEYAYTAYHYQEGLDGEYVLVDTVVATASMDETVTLGVKTYEGFTSPAVEDITITSNSEKNVVKYMYSRNTYTLEWKLNNGDVSNSYTGGEISYGDTITAPILTKTGYTGNWDITPVHIMPANDLVYEMIWTANKYNVTFDNGDGVTIGSKTCTFDESYGTLPDPVKKGYTFAGWYTDAAGGKRVTEDTLMNTAENHTLYAHWDTITYTIGYELNGGTNSSQNPMKYNVEQLVVIKEPTKKGHTFIGWTWEGQDEPIRDVILDGAIENRTYEAHWNINTYKVTFYRENGALIEEQSLDYGTVITPPDAGIRDGYVFSGWGADVPETMPDRNLTFISQWKLTTYEIHYKLDGGENSEDNPAFYTNESQDIIFADPTKTGYTFCGWYNNEDFEEKVTSIAAASVGDITLWAKWKANTYTVVMHINNNTQETITQEFTYGVKQGLTKHKASYKGYSFVGWAIEANGEAIYTNGAKLQNLTDVADGTVHLYGIWELVVYEVSYQNLFEAENNPDNPTEFTVVDNTLVIVDPVGSRVGYNFAGWYADEMLTKPITGSYTVNGAYNINVYAKWDANPYSVTFNNNLRDGSPLGTASQLMVYGSNTNLKPFKEMGFSYKGHTFLGWSTNADDTEPMYTDGQLVSSLVPEGDVTLYAIWSVNVYKISYALGTGATTHTNPLEYNVWTDDITLEAPTDIKSGYQFLGWFDASGNKVTTIVKSSIGDRSYQAKWAHGGIFTLKSSVTTANDTTGVAVTYTIERTLPEGTQATEDPQYVYYRTVNGTAYGGTAARVHFIHVGGEDVYATFDKNTFSKTFTVHQVGYWVGDQDPGTYTSGANRYYDAEIYKVVNTVHGAYTGLLGSNTSHRYNISQGANYKMTNNVYRWNQGDFIPDGTTKWISDAGWGSNFSTSVNPMSHYSSVEKAYATMLNLPLAFHIEMWAVEDSDGWQHVRLSNGGSVFYESKFDMKANEVATNYRQVIFPMTGNQGDVVKGSTTSSCAFGTLDGRAYMQINRLTSVKMEFDASGDKKDDWGAGHTLYRSRFIDNSEPQQLGLAYMAFSQYNPGDKITITVRFNEIVASGSNVKVGTIAGIPASNWTYVGGYGTNALTFTGTVTSFIDLTPTLNNSLANIKPLTGSFYDIN